MFRAFQRKAMELFSRLGITAQVSDCGIASASSWLQGSERIIGFQKGSTAAQDHATIHRRSQHVKHPWAAVLLWRIIVDDAASRNPCCAKTRLAWGGPSVIVCEICSTSHWSHPTDRLGHCTVRCNWNEKGSRPNFKPLADYLHTVFYAIISK